MTDFGDCFLGLDLGQCSDYTAVAVVERVELKGEWDPALFAWRKVVQLRVRYLERIALGTPYPDVVERIRHMTRSGELAGRCRVVADATAVGRPVIEMLQPADLGCRVIPVVVTGGDKEVRDGEYYRVPKRDLIAGLQVLLQQGRLQIAAGLRDCETLVGEMAGMRVRTTAAGNEQFGAWREGQHDDLVFAVALACWGARHVYPFDGPRTGRFLFETFALWTPWFRHGRYGTPETA